MSTHPSFYRKQSYFFLIYLTQICVQFFPNQSCRLFGNQKTAKCFFLPASGIALCFLCILIAHTLDVFLNRYCEDKCPTGTYGWNCSQTCQCAPKSSCSQRDGSCTCTQPGLTGVLCKQPCQQGFYGVDCQKKCLCKNGADCDGVTGEDNSVHRFTFTIILHGSKLIKLLVMSY